MNTGKVVAYNHRDNRGILECRLTGLTYTFVGGAVSHREAHLLKPGVQVFWLSSDNRRTTLVEIMSTALRRFKVKLKAEGSIALD